MNAAPARQPSEPGPGSADGADDDAELLRLVRDGDRAAMAELFRRHYPFAMGYAVNLCRNRADASDIVSDAYLATFRAIEAGNGPTERFRPYLFTAIRHQSFVTIKRRSRVVATADWCVLDARLPAAPAAESVALRRFDDSMALRALRSLPRRWQEVLWKLDVEQRAVADIAAELELSTNSVSALLYRARRGLTNAYLQEHITGHDTPTRCRPYVLEFGAFVRNDLSEGKAALLADHLRSCRSCAALAREVREVNTLIRVRRRGK